MRSLKYTGYFFVLLSLLFGCAPRVFHTIAPDYKERTPRSIAVLPVQNETVDLDAPQAFRSKIFSKILSKGYQSPSTEEIDSKLEKKDIREAGQLGSMPPQEIGEYINSDAVLYTIVTEWSTVYLVGYAAITVGARFQLIDSKTGERLWGSEYAVAERKFGLDEDSVKETLAFAALKRYEPYVKRVIETAFATLPNGFGYVPVKKHERYVPKREEPRRVPPRRILIY